MLLLFLSLSSLILPYLDSKIHASINDNYYDINIVHAAALRAITGCLCINDRGSTQYSPSDIGENSSSSESLSKCLSFRYIKAIIMVVFKMKVFFGVYVLVVGGRQG